MWSFLHRLGSPKLFFTLIPKLQAPVAILGMISLFIGLVGGLALAPPDYQQGDAFRIMYVHVPSAMLSLAVYVFMALSSFVYLVWKIKLSAIFMRSSASLGAWFTALALMTGALWGKPMWGTWWIWDARLTSELILLFLYLGFIGLQTSLERHPARDKIVAFLVITGIVNIPIIHYSVYWWHTLHQGSTLLRFAKPAIAFSMLYPLIAMVIAFFCYFVFVVLLKVRLEVLRQESHTEWVKTWIRQQGD